MTAPATYNEPKRTPWVGLRIRWSGVRIPPGAPEFPRGILAHAGQQWPPLAHQSQPGWQRTTLASIHVSLPTSSGPLQFKPSTGSGVADADAVAGNLPLLGGEHLRGALGEECLDALLQVCGRRLPPKADLCRYWHGRQRAEISAGRLKRAGLLATRTSAVGPTGAFSKRRSRLRSSEPRHEPCGGLTTPRAVVSGPGYLARPAPGLLDLPAHIAPTTSLWPQNSVRRPSVERATSTSAQRAKSSWPSPACSSMSTS